MKRPAAFTTLSKYSKMKGVTKLVTGKTPKKKDTDSCFSEILEQTLDSVFCLDTPTPCKVPQMSPIGKGRSPAEPDESGQEEVEQPAKLARRLAPARLPLQRSAELASNADHQEVFKTPVAKEAALVAARKKQLKLLSKEALQELASSKELDIGKKDDMIDAILAHEAQGREDMRAREGQARQVLANKKQELDTQNASALKQLCSKQRLKLSGPKHEQVKRLLAKWKEEGGVEESLQALARKSRRNQLATLDKKALLQLCNKRRIDALVKEVMVERLLSYEIVKGL